MVTLNDEQREFLLHKTRTGKFATVRKDGRPHVVPVWFVLDGDILVFTTGNISVKAANIRRDSRVTICVDDENPPYSFIMIEGTAFLEDNCAMLKDWTTRIGGRYMGNALAEQYGERNSTSDELLVRITPTKIIFGKDLAI